MGRLTAFRILFSLGALLFIAKPFLGFDSSSNFTRAAHTDTILVKSFAKRKPESIDDADANVRSIHQLLDNPILILLASISLFLLVFFPLTLKIRNQIAGLSLSRIRCSLLPPYPTLLLSGKLSI